MNINRIFKNIEYTTKEMLGYFLVANKKVQEKQELTLREYIRQLVLAIESIDRKYILTEIDVSKIADFPFAHILNNEEMMCYGLIVFYNLLNSNKHVTEPDIISQTETEMRLYSSRKIIDKAEKLLDKIEEN